MPPFKRKRTPSFMLDKDKRLNRFVANVKIENNMTHIIDMGDQVIYIGIIGKWLIVDTLTNFGALKKLEYVAKSCFQGSGISCWPPFKYQKRFYKFMESALSTS